MLKIEGVTKANFDKYGKELLHISQQYAGQKLGKYSLNYQYYVKVDKINVGGFPPPPILGFF